jgi:hypothetical protein
MKGLSFQVISDIHHEMYDKYIPSIALPHASADVLVVAGDLFPAYHANSFIEALNRMYGKHTVVLFVPGNHEYYSSTNNSFTKSDFTMKNLDTFMRGACKMVGGDTFRFLNRDAVDINNCRFLGATMWTNIPSSKFDSARSYVNDYSHIIGNDGRTVEPSDIVREHEISRDWMKYQLEEADHCSLRGVVSITHHVPDVRLAIKDSESHVAPDSRCFYYSTDMLPLFNHKNLIAWCHGHDHHSRQIRLTSGGPAFLSNSLGYPMEYQSKNGLRGFTPDRSFIIS